MATNSGLKLELRDKKGTLLATYDLRTNTTSSNRGKVIGKGNLLNLIFSDHATKATLSAKAELASKARKAA